MKAAKLNQRPAFALMKQTDIQSVHHLPPTWIRGFIWWWKPASPKM